MTGIITPAYSVSKRTGSDGLLSPADLDAHRDLKPFSFPAFDEWSGFPSRVVVAVQIAGTKVFSRHFAAFAKLAKYVLEHLVPEHVETVKCRTVELKGSPQLSHLAYRSALT
jgi:hypothetical protein